MRKRINIIFLLVMTFMPIVVHAQCKDDQSFLDFFRKFRAGVELNDPERIAQYTSFPFLAKIQMDSDAPLRVSKRQFTKYYKYIMNMEVETNETLPKKVTERDLLLSNLPFNKVAKFSCMRDGEKLTLYKEVDIGQLGFKRDKKGFWYLKEGFLGDVYGYIQDNVEPVE